MSTRRASLLGMLVGPAVFAALAAAGCRFVSPSVEEQHALAAQGAFSGGVPAWSTMSGIGRSDDGLIPQQYATRSTHDITDRTFSAARHQREETRARLEELADVDNEDALQDIQTRPDSPLARITASCPAQEGAVTEAITTTDRIARIKKYRLLTRSCPGSADLWYWLGRDYAAEGRTSEARQALEQAAYLDPAHAEAKQLLSELSSTKQ